MLQRKRQSFYRNFTIVKYKSYEVSGKNKVVNEHQEKKFNYGVIYIDLSSSSFKKYI